MDLVHDVITGSRRSARADLATGDKVNTCLSYPHKATESYKKPYKYNKFDYDKHATSDAIPCLNGIDGIYSLDPVPWHGHTCSTSEHQE